MGDFEGFKKQVGLVLLFILTGFIFVLSNKVINLSYNKVVYEGQVLVGDKVKEGDNYNVMVTTDFGKKVYVITNRDFYNYCKQRDIKNVKLKIVDKGILKSKPKFDCRDLSNIKNSEDWLENYTSKYWEKIYKLISHT